VYGFPEVIKQAREVLKTEGFDTKDLQEAKELLGELT
jgi:hypothetical protein